MGRRRNPFVDDLAGASDDDGEIEVYDEPNEYLATQEGYTHDDDDENDPDDLDIIKVVRKDLNLAKGDDSGGIDVDDGSDTEDESDYDAVEDAVTEVSKAKGKTMETAFAQAGKAQKAKIEAQEKADHQASLHTSRSGHSSTDERIEWDSKNEEGLNADYLAFRDRKSKKRKRAATKAGVSKARAVQSNVNAIKKGKQPVNAVVGRMPAKKRRNEPVYRGPEDDSEEDLENRIDDEHLPDYLQTRMTQFKTAHERLGNAALKLPPSYDDVEFSDDERMDELLEKPSLPELKPCAEYQDIELPYSGGIIPAPIAQWLRDYQVKGAAFLHELFVFQRGGILGDDMGLGKTIQVISFLTAAFGKTADERDRKRRQKKRRYSNGWYPRVLIICPIGLVANWNAELDRWGWWDVYIYHGTKSQKEAALSAAQRGSAEIMITGYDTYKSSLSHINTVDWDCVIADEFHEIRNRASAKTIAMSEVNAMCRIGLTGTAIQNNYDELFTLLNWTNPGKFGALSRWKEHISIPLQAGQSFDATEFQLGRARKLARSLVDNLLPQFFLRRMKSLIADQLPKKSDRVVFCPLTDTQAEAYANYVSSDLISFLRRVSEPCDCGSNKTYGGCCGREVEEFENWRRFVFPTITTLQKMCNHLAMIIPSKQDPLDKQEKDVEHLKMAFPNEWREIYNDADSIHHLINTEFCGKYKILRKLLAFWHSNGDKVLIFSHSVRLLRMLQMLFDREAQYNVCCLNGSMKREDRDQAVFEFNSDPKQFIFLISTKAGGVGLNITSANKVVIIDPNWNPAYDQQAQDRAFRIGQKRDVEVFRLISAGTIEEIVYARQIYKQQQANIGYTASSERRYFTGIQNRPEQRGEIFGLANMFSYQGEGVVLQQIVNKTNVAESRLGLVVSDIDMSQLASGDEILNGDENSAMKELEALITEGDSSAKNKKPGQQKLSPVQAILANAGVSYTHENSEVIGTSRTEYHLSRKAAEAAVSTHEVANRRVFGGSQHLRDGNDGSGVAVRYRYNPPEDVRKRQFCEMARMFGFRDAVEFALVVEGWTQKERRNCLDKFYWMRRQALSDGGLHASALNAETARYDQPVGGSPAEHLPSDAEKDVNREVNEGLTTLVHATVEPAKDTNAQRDDDYTDDEL